MDSECTAEEFAAIVNPYTGDRIVTHLVMVGHVPKFYAPDTYSPQSARCATAADAVSMWTRVDGVAGARDPARGISCAYTGEPLKLCRDDRGWFLGGGFDPTILHPREEYLRCAKSRGRLPAPAPDARVEAVPERVPAPLSRPARELDRAIEAAESSLHAVGVRPSQSTVSVPEGAPRKKGRH